MTKPSVVILDYGSGNLRSAERALERAGADVVVTDDLSVAADANGLVVPGVGAYAACMAGIDKLGAAEVIRLRVEDERPVLGICVGMQVLFSAGTEHGVTSDGVGVFPGEVRRLRAERVPHMGWNTVTAPAESELFAGVAATERFFFVHSYAAKDPELLPPDAIATTAVHGGDRFIAAVEWRSVWAAQFHPEKSGDAGARLLSTWVRTLS